jgi:hypothetical protein
VLCPRVCFAPLQDLQSIHLGKLEIKQDEPDILTGVSHRISSIGKQALQRLFPVPHHMDFVRDMVFLKGTHRDFDVLRIVFDQ